MTLRFHCRKTQLWFVASLLLSIEKQPPIADKREINTAEINTTLSISPFCLREYSQAMTSQSAGSVI